MANINEKEALGRAIIRRVNATCLSDRQSAWQDIRDAIMALDNAAYDHGADEARDQYAYKDRTIALQSRRISALLEERDELQRQFDERGRERDALQGQLQTQVPALRTLLEEAEAERDGFCGELELLHRRTSEGRDQLRAELADARDMIRTMGAGESVDANVGVISGGDVSCFHGKIDTVLAVNRALTSKEVKEVARQLFAARIYATGREGMGRTTVERKLFNARKPEPEIEAVLMGSDIDCACDCGVTVPAGQCAYRYVKHVLAMPPLYASEECARKAAQKPPEAPTVPDPEFVYECSSSGGCGSTWRTAMLDGGRCPKCFQGSPGLRIVEQQS